MWYRVNKINIFIKIFVKMIVIINFIAVTHFLRQCVMVYLTICSFVISFKHGEFFRSVSMNFGIVKTKSQRMLY